MEDKKNQAQELLEKAKAFVKENMLVSVGAVVGLILIILFAFSFSSSSVTIDLAQYVDLEPVGYDTAGTARVVYDTDGLAKKYGKKLAKNYQKQHSNRSYSSQITPQSVVDIFLNECVDAFVEDNEDLSNGDQIKVELLVDNYYAENSFGAKIKDTEFTVSVDGFEEIVQVDPFADMELRFDGVSPKGYAEIEKKTDEYDFQYEVVDNGTLANGENVTVRVLYVDDQLDYFKHDGILMTKVSEEFPVEGLSYYLDDLSELKNEDIDRLDREAKDIFTAYVNKKWVKSASINKIELDEIYLLNKKSQDINGEENILRLIYKVTADMKHDADTVQDTVTIYTSVTYTDLSISDGDLLVDLTEGKLTDHTTKKSLKNTRGHEITYVFVGYDTSEDCFNDVVGKYVDKYNYSSIKVSSD